MSYARRIRREAAIRVVADAVMVNAAFLLALAIRLLWAVWADPNLASRKLFERYMTIYGQSALLLTILALVIFWRAGFYTHGRAYRGRYKALVISEAVSLAYLVYAVIARFLTSDHIYRIIISPVWILMILVLTPLLCILGINAGIIVSSRVNDPRAAEQLGSLVMLPILALYGVQFAGWVSINLVTFLAGVGITMVIDAIVLWIGVKLFHRETILTRWSG